MKEKMFKYIALSCCFLMAGCGFSPLYAQKGKVLEATEAIDVEPISGEAGYQMALILENRLNPQNKATSKKYRLIVDLQQPVHYNQSIRSDNFASLEKVVLKAKYKLIEIQGNKEIINSTVDSNGLFNLIKDPYATVVAQDKLYENMVRNISEDIATHILSYFSGESK